MRPDRLSFHDQKKLVQKTNLFDTVHYTKNNPDILNKIEALDHYLIYGYKENREPFEEFNSAEIFRRYPESKNYNPLVYCIYNNIPVFRKVPPIENKIIPSPPRQSRPNVIPLISSPIQKENNTTRIKLFEFNHSEDKVYKKLTLLKDIKIGVVIPTAWKKGSLTTTLIDFFTSKEINVVLVNNSFHSIDYKEKYCKVVEYNYPFNFSKINNFGTGFLPEDVNVFLFCNDDLEVFQEDWLSKLLETFQDRSVGCCGPVSFNSDGSLQGAGAKMRLEDSGVIGLNVLPTNLTEVQTLGGCCIAIRKDVFNKIKGFREEFIITHSDTTMGLDVNNTGYKVIVNPFSKIKHYERTSRGKDLLQDTVSFWKMYSKDILKYSSIELPRKGLIITYPEFLDLNKIKKIILLKLDHFGDTVIATNVINKFKNICSDITIVCGSWMENYFKELGFKDIVSIDFFGKNGVMGGIRGLKEEDKIKLSKLEGDLGVDLRVGSETRFILDIINVKFKAGFLSTPYIDLDFNLPYEVFSKKIHNGTQLELLFSRIPFYQSDTQKNAQSDTIVINPFASSPQKSMSDLQWILLIDKLEMCNFRILLAADKENKNNLNKYLRKNIEILPFFEFYDFGEYISDLNPLCYIGVDTGPTHLVASKGVNVIEIMSGLVPPEEWQSYGPNTITLTNITTKNCNPCYNLNCQHRECIEKIEPKDILWAIGKFIK